MTKGIRYAEEFKRNAVSQVVNRGYSVQEIADRLGVTTDLVLQALLMARWRRKPKSKVLIHSDQGSQFTSLEWKQFLASHNLEASKSRRGNCHE